MLKRSRLPLLATPLLILSACGDAGRTPLAPGEAPAGVALQISDAATGGTAGFFFVAPLVKNSGFTGTFAPNLLPVALVYEGATCAGPSIARFETGAGPSALTVDLGFAVV